MTHMCNSIICYPVVKFSALSLMTLYDVCARYHLSQKNNMVRCQAMNLGAVGEIGMCMDGKLFFEEWSTIF